MATINYFSDIDGDACKLKAPYGMQNAEFASKFPGVKGIRYGSFMMWVGYPLQGSGGVMPVTRMIEMKSSPSKHECNAKCLNGKHNGACECKCGGENHGRGLFTNLLKAA